MCPDNYGRILRRASYALFSRGFITCNIMSRSKNAERVRRRARGWGRVRRSPLQIFGARRRFSMLARQDTRNRVHVFARTVLEKRHLIFENDTKFGTRIMTTMIINKTPRNSSLFVFFTRTMTVGFIKTTYVFHLTWRPNRDAGFYVL